MSVATTLANTDTDKLNRLLAVSQVITRRLDLKALLREVIVQASELVSADRCTLWLHDPVRGDIYTFIGQGLDEQIFRMPLGRGVAGMAAMERRTIVENDPYNSPYFNPAMDRQSGYRTRSLLAVPMQSHEGRLLGCFQAINRLDESREDGVGAFSEEDVELLSALSGIAAIALENSMLYEEQQRQFQSVIVTLATSVDAMDPTTANHTKQVTGISVALAKQMELSERAVERIRIAAILHDFGKIGVPDTILTKPGALSDEEFLMMRSHCLKSILLLRKIAFRRDLSDVPDVAGQHHEKLDGTGYPFGLRGDEITLEGRIIAVADVFQALTQTRPYKAGRTPSEALSICRQMTQSYTDHHGRVSGVHLDELVVDALEALLERWHGDMAFFEAESGWEQMLSGGIN
jgi:HD-GYP domain-containing protein (c-di-GMP phosphodiesterase class II)